MDRTRIDKTITIVGNGASVLHKELGPQIDACDVVLRFNDFVIKSYEKNVGTKTDIWWGYNAPHPQLSTFKEVVFPWIGEDNLWPLYQKIWPKCIKHNIPCTILDKYIVKQAYKILGVPYNCIPKPTTGLVDLLWAKQTYKHVQFTGIDCFTSGFHYYKNKRPEMLNVVHNPKRELQIINQWKNPVGIKEL